MLRNTLLFFLLLGASLKLVAQVPVIVKDYNNCTVGLQDGNGNWIVQPIYDHIDPLVDNVAIVIRAGKKGLIRSNGKEVIPAIYQTLFFVYDQSTKGSYQSRVYVEVSDGKLSGVLDTTGKVIVPLKYTGISNKCDVAFKVKDKDGIWSFYHLNGDVFSTGLYAEPDLISYRLYSFKKTEEFPDPKKPGKKTYKVGTGLMNDSGTVLIPPDYDEIKVSEHHFKGYQVQRRGKYGYYDTNFKQILACEYDVWHTTETYDSKVHPYLFIFGITSATKDGKSGVISFTGDTILPFVFDSICKPEQYFRNSKSFPVWEVVLNSKWGLTDSVGNWILPPSLDSGDLCLNTTYRNSKYTLANESSYYVGHVNGKHGAINLNRDTVVPFVYDTSWTNKQTTTFWSKDEAIRLDYSYQECPIAVTYSTVLRWFGSDTSILKHVRNWWGDEGYYPHQLDSQLRYNEIVWSKLMDRNYNKIPPEAKKAKYPFLYQCPQENQLIYTHLKRVNSNNQGYFSYLGKDNQQQRNAYWSEEYYQYGPQERIEVIFDSVSGGLWRNAWKDPETGNIVFGDVRTGYGVLSTTGNVIVPPGVYRYVYQNNNYKKEIVYSLHTFSGKVGLIDSTGKFILDTIWTRILVTSSDTVWVERGGFYATWNDYNCGQLWCAVNIANGKMIVDSSLKLTQIFPLQKRIQVISTQSGVGLIDGTTLQIILPPVYSELVELDDSLKYFAVVDCKGKTGIVDYTGKIIVAPKYTNLHMTECRSTIVNGKKQAIETYVLYNSERDFAVFRTNTGTVSYDTSEYKKIVAMMLSQPAELSNQSGMTYRQRNVKFVTIVKPMSLSLNDWQNHWFFQNIFTAASYRDYRTYCAGRNSKCACVGNSVARVHFDTKTYQPEYKIEFLTDSFMSINFTRNYGWTYYSHTGWTGYSLANMNIVQTARGPVQLDLFSLFTDTTWKHVVIDSVMNYLKSHSGIDADCSKPGLYPNILNNSYSVSESGIYLYPAWRKMTNGEVLKERPIIFIPWTGLRPHLKPEMERKIFDK